MIKKVKNTGSLTLCTGEKTVGTFYENKFQKQIKKNLELKKTIKRKGNKLYVK